MAPDPVDGIDLHRPQPEQVTFRHHQPLAAAHTVGVPALLDRTIQAWGQVRPCGGSCPGRGHGLGRRTGGRHHRRGDWPRPLGHPNRFPRPGRPESAFGPKGSRIARYLLTDLDTPVRQRDLATSTGLNEGHVSRIVGKLADIGLVQRGDDGIQITDKDLLLDAWREEYRFDRHTVITGHVAARSGDALTRSLVTTLSEMEVPHATTGLSAAWLWTRRTGFRLATVYMADIPSDGLMADLGFREEPRGANTWLVVPNDEGVFHGASQVDGLRCVHPVQAYLDLKDHPERASEAADELRAKHFGHRAR